MYTYVLYVCVIKDIMHIIYIYYKYVFNMFYYIYIFYCHVVLGSILVSTHQMLVAPLQDTPKWLQTPKCPLRRGHRHLSETPPISISEEFSHLFHKLIFCSTSYAVSRCITSFGLLLRPQQPPF